MGAHVCLLHLVNECLQSSSVGVEPRGDAEVEAQREKLLKACNGFSAFDEHLKGFFNGPVPSETEWGTCKRTVVHSGVSSSAFMMRSYREVSSRSPCYI